MKREVNVGSNTKRIIDLNNPVYRYDHNPVLTTHEIKQSGQIRDYK